MYSEQGWNELYKEFNQGGEHNQERRRLARKILSGVVYGEVDKGGRLTLNSTLKEYAGIKCRHCDNIISKDAKECSFCGLDPEKV